MRPARIWSVDFTKSYVDTIGASELNGSDLYTILYWKSFLRWTAIVTWKIKMFVGSPITFKKKLKLLFYIFKLF